MNRTAFKRFNSNHNSGKVSVMLEYLSDSRISVNKSGLHCREEAAQVLCKLLPCDIVQELLQAVADSLEQKQASDRALLPDMLGSQRLKAASGRTLRSSSL